MSSQKKSNFLGSLQYTGVSVDEIQKYTGVSVEEIEAFRKEME